MRMSLTNRLLLFFVATLALVLAGFSGALYYLAQVYLHQQTDERLEAAMSTLVAVVEVGPDGLEWDPSERSLILGHGPLGGQVEWLVSDDLGRVIGQSNGAETARLSEEFEALRNTQPFSARLTLGEGAWQITQRWVFPRGTGPYHTPPLPKGAKDAKYAALAVTVGIPLAPVHAALGRLAIVLTCMCVAVWISTLVVGRWLCQRALAPVTIMAASARTMNATDFSERLPASGTGDELEIFGSAFNSLLGRLQESFNRERRFTGEASHQLRTPLTVMRGQIDVALRCRRSTDEYERVLGIVQRQATSLQRIVESLLFLARAESESQLPDLEKLDLGEWLTQLVASWSESERAKCVRIERPAGEPLWVEAHSTLLAELINNLIDNAVKYSPPNSPITLRVERESAHIALSVKDCGEGIPDRDLPHVFEPFFRSANGRDRRHSGTGLGLAVAGRIAKAFGGRITAANRKGVGCRFTVYLPAADPSLHNGCADAKEFPVVFQKVDNRVGPN